MATYRIIRGSTTYDISVGNSIYLEEVDDLGGAGVRNQEESGPFQDGASHLSERLEPSTITMRLIVKGSTAAALDGHRDTLNAMFKPVRGVPITIEVVRDDGETRRLDTYRTGRLAIPMRAMDYAGQIHRAVVQLRGSDPTWYNPTEENESFQASADWWLGYNTIGSANVLEHVDSPGTAQAWALSGTVALGSPWTVAVRTSPASSVTRVMWQAGSLTAVLANEAAGTATGQWKALDDTTGGDTTGIFGITPGTVNYIMIAQPGTAILYRDNVAIGTISGGTAEIPYALGTATPGRWRSNVPHAAGNTWDVAMPHAAVYNIALSASQRSALNDAMAVVGTVYNNAVVYEGDFDSYPVITLTGPIANPSITNTATGDVLNFSVSGGTIPAGSTWVIDTRYGRKSVLQGTSSVAHYLSDDSDLATFHLAPDPIAAGGTNGMVVGGSLLGTATSVTVAWFNRYMDF